MPRGPSKASKPRPKASRPSKPQSKPSKARAPQSDVSWGWQSDGRYIPLTDDGKLPAHLPDHIELHLRNELEGWKRRYFELGRHVERLRAKLIELKFDPDTV